MATPRERFEAVGYTVSESGCWIWNGPIERDGYGRRLSFGSKGNLFRIGPHRLAYQLYKGDIPEGCEIDHECHNQDKTCFDNPCWHRSCVNPDHLNAVPHVVNVRNGRWISFNALKTHCPQGHPYEGNNLYVGPQGTRVCRACKYAANAARSTPRIPSSRPHPNTLKTHCPQGHPYEGDNLVISKRGGRCCRECTRTQLRRSRAKLKGA